MTVSCGLPCGLYRAVTLIAFTSVAFAGCATPGPAQDSTANPCLQLTIQSTVGDAVAPGDVPLRYEVRNRCSTAVVFCAPSEPACAPSWEDPEGVFNGVGFGWPDPYDCPFDRMKTLAGGEHLSGDTKVAVFATPKGTISVHCEYQSSGSCTKWGFNSWVGRIQSNWLSLVISRAS